MISKIQLSKLFLFGSSLFLLSCKENKKTKVQDEPDMPVIAPNYDLSQNDDLAYLGRVLFYDKKLSSDNSTSCSSCHNQSKAFADNHKVSVGVLGQLSTRNSPMVFPKQGKMFWDGRAANLDEMVLMPIMDEKEMNCKDIDQLCAKLSKTSYYPKLFKRAFNDEALTKDRLKRALKEFVLNCNFSKNKFASSQMGISNKLNTEEEAGKNLFFGKAKCSECHQLAGGNFGNVYYGPKIEAHNIGLDYEYTDKGCGVTNNNEKDNGKFMMPILQNIELTSPYMHDGRFATLEEVVEHYDNKVILNPNLDWRLKDFSEFKNLSEARSKLDKNFDGDIDNTEAPNRKAQKLNLSDKEKSDLVVFLKTLTDRSVLTDSKFGNPFKH
jgi:cytochrome c peroxidase